MQVSLQPRYMLSPNFQNGARCEKDVKNNKHNRLHLGRKYARIFVLGHYLFLDGHSFLRAALSENCLLIRTYNVRGQISEHIFALNGGCLFIPCSRNMVSVRGGFGVFSLLSYFSFL